MERAFLEALKDEFTHFNPHPSGTGKLLNERLVQNSTQNIKSSQFYYFRSIRKKLIHLVEEKADGSLFASQIMVHEAIKKIDSELMKSFLKKNSESLGVVYAPIHQKMKVNEGK